MAAESYPCPLCKRRILLGPDGRFVSHRPPGDSYRLCFASGGLPERRPRLAVTPGLGLPGSESPTSGTQDGATH